MKKITITTYKSFFGYHYKTKEECWKHEKIQHQVFEILSPLKRIPPELLTDWYNSGGYIQQDINVVKDVKDKFLLFLKTLINRRDFDNLYDATLKQENSGKYLGGIFYYLDNTDYRYLMSDIDKLICIDKDGKQYAKQFFMLNPNEREHKEIFI
jgi:hypothetical protein